MRHALVVCVRTKAWMRYSFRNWAACFGCPECGRFGWFSLNYLGQRKVICDGQRFRRMLP